LCQSVFAEDYNAYNVTIYNPLNSSEVIYQNIVPDSQPFNYVNTIYGNGSNVTINISYDPTQKKWHIRKNDTNNNIMNLNIAANNINIGGLVRIKHIHYDFPPPSNTTSNTTTTSSTKTPIPIGAYLITTAFFTYILYRKSKT